MHTCLSGMREWSISIGSGIKYDYVMLGLISFIVHSRLQLPKDKRLSYLESRVTSMLLQQQPSSTLWLGLGSGHLLLVNSITRVPLMVVKRHMSAVRGLLSVRALVGEKPAHLILSGGIGFQQRPANSSQAKGGKSILIMSAEY